MRRPLPKERILTLCAAGASTRVIAAVVGVSPSSVARVIARARGGASITVAVKAGAYDRFLSVVREGEGGATSAEVFAAAGVSYTTGLACHKKAKACGDLPADHFFQRRPPYSIGAATPPARHRFVCPGVAPTTEEKDFFRAIMARALKMGGGRGISFLRRAAKAPTALAPMFAEVIDVMAAHGGLCIWVDSPRAVADVHDGPRAQRAFFFSPSGSPAAACAEEGGAA